MLKILESNLWLACHAFNLFGLLHHLRHMDFRSEGIGEGEGGEPWRFSAGGRERDLEGDWGLEGEGGHSTWKAEALWELGVEEFPHIEDLVSSDSMARHAKRLNDSLGASCLFDFSALRLADVLVSAALWGLTA
ncbi:hypothetical protein PoB_004939300 [Plakobranchus ocellatus]|uniref:Uncharacterized protein n=1 Tax=Plakobranchus ocellatus TaxID=259542 RepID=A0AAV4BVQ8_9GAST|nr:hypothetical protein PoB_004939300 [Plakobranchus ocellatus]